MNSERRWVRKNEHKKIRDLNKINRKKKNSN